MACLSTLPASLRASAAFASPKCHLKGASSGDASSSPTTVSLSKRAKELLLSSGRSLQVPRAGLELGVRADDEPIQAQDYKTLEGGEGILVGTRIPKDYFLACGFGETNEGGGIDPWETGAYDLALEEAGIQDFNIVPYTSVVPPEAREISYESAKKYFHHGAVLETIMSQMNGSQGDRLSAGVGQMQILNKKTGKYIGGYAAEYKGHAREEQVKEILTSDLMGIFDRRFSHDEYEAVDLKFTIREGEVEKNYGTVLAAICFVTYIFPVYPSLK